MAGLLASKVNSGFFLLHDGAALVVTALRADYVRWNSTAALWAVRDRTFFQTIVGATATGTGIGVFAFGDCHDGGPKGGWGAGAPKCMIL